MLWLGDDRNGCEAAERFPEMEILSMSAFKNGAFRREFTAVLPLQVRQHASFLRAERDALYSMQRYENVGQIPFLKRRSYVSTVADFLFSFIKQTSPTHVILSEAPHTVSDLVAVGICEALGHPILHFQKCGVAPLSRPRLGMTYESAGHLLPAGSDLDTPDRPVCASVPWLDMLRSRLEEEQLPDYELKNASREERLRGPKGKIRQFMPAFFGLRLLRTIESEHGSASGPRLHQTSASDGVRATFQDLKQTISVTRTQRSSLRGMERVQRNFRVNRLERNAITLFLHYEPEMTSIPDAQFHSEQLAVARALSVEAPESYTVYVREHPSQLLFSTRGFLGRDVAFYEELCALPRVRLLATSMPYLDVIRNSDLVVTLNGTVAVEAALVGTPAVAVGRPWYEDLEGCFVATDLAHIGETILSALASERRPLGEAKLLKFLSNYFFESVPVPSEANRWEEFGWSPDSEIDQLTEVLQKFLDREGCKRAVNGGAGSS